MWWVLQAWAAVTVDDPGRCVDGARLEDELALLFGDATLASLDVDVEVVQIGERHQAMLMVRENQRRVWSRTLILEATDCGEAAEAAALSIHQGLAALPGWDPELVPEEARLRGAIELVTTSSLQLDGRFELGGGADVRLAGRIWLGARARLGTSAPIAVGSGRVTLLTAQGALLLSGNAPVGTSAFEVAGGLAAGPVWALGQGFDTNQTGLRLRPSAELSVSWLTPGPIRIGIISEVPLNRLVLVESGGSSRAEPWVRLGLSLGLRL